MEFQISRNDYNKTQIVASHTHERVLSEGEVLLKVDSFALTANNITYAVVGDKLGYWQFFPPTKGNANETDGTSSDIAKEHWGILPVWGFADVIKSNNLEVVEGERLFGYFPPASHLVMKPTAVSPTSWIDGSEHRAHLPVGYNIYRRVHAEAELQKKPYDKAFEPYRMLLYPLHITAFSLFDYFNTNDWFGATQLVMLSASSKTSTGLAYGIAQNASSSSSSMMPTQVALTSAGNKAMVEGLKVYDQTLAYDELEKIDASKPTLVVDMSGNGQLLSDLHHHLGDNMKFCSNVGVTHWEDVQHGPYFNAERSKMFFAPSQLQALIKEHGMSGFEKLSNDYLKHSISESAKWLKITELDGLQEMNDIFGDVCNGKVSPELGLIIKL
jgi:hypothetical protein